MDSFDTRIIGALRRDARISLSNLALEVGLSRVTVRARLNRLRESGVIVGYTVVLAEDMQHHPVRGLMMLGIEGRGADKITRLLSNVPAVQAVHSTNGKWDLIVELGTQTLYDLDGVLTRIRKFDGVTTSETNLLLATQMATRVPERLVSVD
ncbi:Lrp/AsnC family transcriptional regulator [Algicella marina]|uniref:AsnC family transcriptional regulator n=1 Tax=Algicella marina TaxID=2683284 RepID=A0A6P1T116_9RHOB|nr:Lrp/AsnC family transcriptional regulator [Algicella marina]QHQ35510.1 AsnC family transcriptional regulator [Algicella marina]